MISETLTFVILGVSMVSILNIIRNNPALMICTTCIVFIARFISVYPSCWLANLFREKKISKSMMFVVSYAGPRGSMSYALAIKGLEQILDGSQSYLIVGMTTCYIIFSIFVVGSSLAPVCKICHLSGNGSNKLENTISPRENNSDESIL